MDLFLLSWWSRREFHSLLRNLPPCVSPFSRLGPLPTHLSTGQFRFTVALFRVRLSSSIMTIKKGPDGPIFIVVVEPARVELASESISTGVSPSAADDLDFAFLTVRQQTDRKTIPLFPYDTGNSRKVFLYDSMPGIRPTGKSELTRVLRKLSS